MATKKSTEAAPATQFVSYKGPSDFRVLTKADLRNDEADFSKSTFAKGVPHEVSDSAAKVLLETFAHEFERASEEQLEMLNRELNDEDVNLDDEVIVSQSTSEGSGTGASTSGTPSAKSADTAS